MNVPRIRRWVLRGLAVPAFAALVGATYQGVTTAMERRAFPQPGRMVDVGDHQLHLTCTGEGLPTVVLEAPAAGLSAAWGGVQPGLADTTRVCSYDRAGLGWSEAREGAFEPGLAIDDLRRLLDGAGEPGPYVLVGQGLGASLVQAFAARYAADTRALVLVDPPAPDTIDGGSPLVRSPRLTPWLARVGVLRAFRVHTGLTDGIPQPFGGALATFLNRPDHLTRSAAELARWDDVVRAGAATAPEAVPHATVTTGPSRRVAFLTEEADAGRVVAAVREVIQASER
jgi:pimeloyl-ACP methyl ester carboxylesterase